MLAVVPGIYRLSDWLDEDVRFTMIDVGQGLSQLIELPGGAKILVDGGGMPGTSFDIGEAVLGPYLRTRRINAFDLVVSTHPHPDHYDGLRWIMRHTRVKKFWVSALQPESGDLGYADLLTAAKDRGVPMTVVDSSSPPEKFGAATLTVIWPPTETADGADLSHNDASLVMRLDFGKTSFLMCADMEAESEKRIAESEAPLLSTVMAVGHHGGRTSAGSEFLRLVQPRIALIPAGRANRYGHPDPATVGRLLSSGAAVFRIDRDGQIRCRSDGVRVACTPFYPAD